MTTTTAGTTRRQLTARIAHTADLNNDVLNPLSAASRREVRALLAEAQQDVTAGRYTLASQLLDEAWEMLEG